MTLRFRLAGLLSLLAASATAAAPSLPLEVRRVAEAPIITGDLLPGDDGASINGPSLLRVPAWVKNPLGRYYLYFSHHAGKYLRLAYADRLEGPWKILPQGVLALDSQKTVTDHIASPQVVVDDASRRIFLYYHGVNPDPKAAGDDEGNQVSGCAVSADGLNFTPVGGVVGPAYLQVFPFAEKWYALNHTGVLRGAAGPEGPFKPVASLLGPEILESVDPARLGEPGATPAAERPARGPFRYTIRHVGVGLRGRRLDVYFTCVGHRPERILRTSVVLDGPPDTWRARGVTEVLRPEKPWEGADQPLAYSRGGIARKRLNELRDPAILSDDGRTWLVYALAGEHGLGLAELLEEAAP